MQHSYKRFSGEKLTKQFSHKGTKITGGTDQFWTQVPARRAVWRGHG